MTTLEEKQKAAFEDLMTANCFVNPTRFDVTEASETTIKLLFLAASPNVPDGCVLDSDDTNNLNTINQYRVVMGVFNDTYNSYNNLIGWSDLYFVSPNPPYQQQHIYTLMSTASVVADIMDKVGSRTQWNNLDVYNPISPDDNTTKNKLNHNLMGGKFNDKWYDDLLGSVSGMLLLEEQPLYKIKKIIEEQLFSLNDYTTFITEFDDAITIYNNNTDKCDALKTLLLTFANILTNIQTAVKYMKLYGAVYSSDTVLYTEPSFQLYQNDIQLILNTYQQDLEDYQQDLEDYQQKLDQHEADPNNYPLPPLPPFTDVTTAFNTAVGEIDTQYNILYSNLSNRYTDMTRPLETLRQPPKEIDDQVAREQWWWNSMIDDAPISKYSRASQIAVAGSVAFNGLRTGTIAIPSIKNMFERTAKPSLNDVINHDPDVI